MKALKRIQSMLILLALRLKLIRCDIVIFAVKSEQYIMLRSCMSKIDSFFQTIYLLIRLYRSTLNKGKTPADRVLYADKVTHRLLCIQILALRKYNRDLTVELGKSVASLSNDIGVPQHEIREWIGD